MGIPLQTIAIADSDAAQTGIFQQFAQAHSYACVGVAHNPIEAIALVQTFKPQILLLHIDLPGLSGLQGIRQLLQFKTTALVLLTSDPDHPLCQPALDLGAEAVVVTPWQAPQLRATLKTAWHEFQRDQTRQTDIEALKDALETRKLIDRAKGILMQERGISEPEAYRLLQKMSQDKRVSIKDVCRAVEQVRSIVGTKTKRKATP